MTFTSTEQAMTKIAGESGSPCLMPDAGDTEMSFTTPLPTANTNGALNINISNAIRGIGMAKCRKKAAM